MNNDPEKSPTKSAMISRSDSSQFGNLSLTLTSTGYHKKLALVMVGLPARGKTYISQKISHYLRWMGVETRVFNVGNYRRKQCGAQQPHSFFDTNNEEANHQRLLAASDALHDMARCLEEGKCEVGIYDATNTTRDRRSLVLEYCEKRNIEVMFVESICTDEDVIVGNIKEVKLSSPDYVDMDPDQAVEDFKRRISHYERVYEPLSEAEGPFVKLINVGTQFIVNRVRSYLQSRIIYYVMNLHITPRSIYLTRHGESQFNQAGRIGGDAPLSPNGLEFARLLPDFLTRHVPHDKLTVWTSTLRRTQETAQFLNLPIVPWRALDEIDAGVCDGLTYEEIEEKYPEEFAARDDDKLCYRYRGGESYKDLVLRLEPIIMELERQTNILIIGHQAVLRCIYGYFMNFLQEEIPHLRIPLHTVIKLTPKAYGCHEEHFELFVPAVDTHRDARMAAAERRLRQQEHQT